LIDLFKTEFPIVLAPTAGVMDADLAIAVAQKQGRVDFTNLRAGPAVRMGREMPAAELTPALAGGALARFAQMAG
jgi:NAD(P)H-dependent flavin oxidoreductase YrpB (nitropropane dioxygenase family)